jgi:excisionase family DNA binding protein
VTAQDSSTLQKFIQETVREVLAQLRRGSALLPATLNTTDAARYLGISPSKLSRLRHEGKGPPFIRIGAAVRFPISGLDRWLAEQCGRNTHVTVADHAPVLLDGTT